MTIRAKDVILEDLKTLTLSKGYIYSLCMILYEDFHHNLDKIHQVNYMIRLSKKECSLLIGFLVQNKIDFTFPESPEQVVELKNKTYELMEELHYSLNEPQFSQLNELMKKSAEGEDISNIPYDKVEFFARQGAMVEPMFYAGDGVYDFQYLEYLERKYKYDKEWLQKHKKFDIDSSRKHVQKIKDILQNKSKNVLQLNLKDTFPDIAEKAKKKLKKDHSDEEIKMLEKQNLIAMTFYQYKNLFNNNYEKEHANSEDWMFFYKNLIDLFIVRKTDFDDHSGLDDFLNNFSFAPSPAVNEDFFGPGYYNIINSKPLIKIDKQRYFVPINFLVAEAVYETPFYWMTDDKNYSGELSKHRGDVGEEIAYDFLSQVFGKENTYKSVLVTTKKGQPDTDIDVLCILGNKALCVQVKSKKLTINAKRGNFDQLLKDFKGSVQDAYKQGLVSRSKILNKGAKFKDENGNDLILNSNINEVYIMSLTTENHPSLVHQVKILLSKKEEEPFPFVLSVFDLELLTHYLPDPYDFLYYVRQRIDLLEYFIANEELVFLGYHLQQKLWKIEGRDGVLLRDDFGGAIDRNYYPYKTGLSHLLSEKNDPIHNLWKDPKFDELIKIIKNAKHSHTTDIIFHLLDLSGNARKGIVDQMIHTKNKARKEFSDLAMATSTSPSFGLSYQSLKNSSYEDLDHKITLYATIKKYQIRCNSWLALGSFASSQNLVDFMIYLDEPWIFDPELEEASQLFTKNTKKKVAALNRSLSIGRNDPCPCRSGLKFKRCCG